MSLESTSIKQTPQPPSGGEPVMKVVYRKWEEEAKQPKEQPKENQIAFEDLIKEGATFQINGRTFKVIKENRIDRFVESLAAEPSNTIKLEYFDEKSKKTKTEFMRKDELLNQFNNGQIEVNY